MKRLLIISVSANLLLILMLSFTISRTDTFAILRGKLHKAKPDLYAFKSDGKWNNRLSMLNALPERNGVIILAGTSLTAGCEWSELLNNPCVVNRGISGDVTIGLLERLDGIIRLAPQMIFIEIGINDLSHGLYIKQITHNVDSAITRILRVTPSTEIYLQSLLPVSHNYHVSNDSIQLLNQNFKSLALINGIGYIDLYTSFLQNGQLNPSLTFDGVHLNGTGYSLWSSVLSSYLIK